MLRRVPCPEAPSRHGTGQGGRRRATYGDRSREAELESGYEDDDGRLLGGSWMLDVGVME